MACATCHHPDLAFADGRQFSVGAGGAGLGPGRVGSPSSITGLPIGLEPRNAQTILNAAFNADAAGRPSHAGLQFWDGRASGLEEQARIPIMSRTEMAGDAYPPEVARDSVVARLRVRPARARDAASSQPAVDRDRCPDSRVAGICGRSF